MQGILKSNHQRLCDSLWEIKQNKLVPDNKLNELETELQTVFMNYQQKLSDLKKLVLLYEEKQRSIKNEMKKIRRYSIADSKKLHNHALVKVAGTAIMSIQMINIISIADFTICIYLC